MMKWISVKDRLPENEVDVLVFNPKDGISIGEFDLERVHGYYKKDGTYFITSSGWETEYSWAPYMCPTHWMPLPQPPEVE